MLNSARRDFLKTSAGMALTMSLLGPKALLAQEKGYEDAVLVDGVPGALPDGAFTIAVLPDTQNYSEHFPAIFDAQTQWIADNIAARNIVGVFQLGDITNNNRIPEWENARHSMAILDGKVPYAISPGNHDFGLNGHSQDRTTFLNDYFPVSLYKDRPSFGGNYDKEPDRMDNSYHFFQNGDRKLLILSLEFGPRKDVVRWANEVVEKHKDLEAILITHAYMYHDDTRHDWEQYGKKQLWNPHDYPLAEPTHHDVQDGQELWDNLISKHENFIMTLNGHVLYDGLGYHQGETPSGRNVHEILVNFQMRPQGGDGWLRLLEFQPDGKTVKVIDYSPVRQQLNESAQNKFEFELSPVKNSTTGNV